MSSLSYIFGYALSPEDICVMFPEQKVSCCNCGRIWPRDVLKTARSFFEITDEIVIHDEDFYDHEKDESSLIIGYNIQTVDCCNNIIVSIPIITDSIKEILQNFAEHNKIFENIDPKLYIVYSKWVVSEGG
jgi:hypothetical protein